MVDLAKLQRELAGQQEQVDHRQQEGAAEAQAASDALAAERARRERERSDRRLAGIAARRPRRSPASAVEESPPSSRAKLVDGRG